MTQFTDEVAAPHLVTVVVEDETGEAVANATVGFDGGSVTTDRNGRADLPIDRPTVTVITKSGYLDEPVAVGPADRTTTVRLWAREGPSGGTRASMHFGGDVMLGRRYLDDDRSTPYVHDEASARRVVAELGPMSSAADLTVVNLETVVGELDESMALPAKRFLIQSTPLVTDALDELGVDVVTLGNNHAYDWGETGLTSTFSALEAAGIGHVGAAPAGVDALDGRLVDVGGITLGLVSMTTVTGDYVNDAFPSPDADPPPDLDPADAWQYESRLFGLRAATESDDEIADIGVPLRGIRISEAWEIVEAAERHLSEADAAAVWKLASSAFPELQDWVARRDHGGAARYQRAAVEQEIAQLDREGASFIVVGLHGGYQFAATESAFVRDAARAAIDAGADAVIAHHPHVLQGVEWYGDGLIAYSLGNLVFDQDLLSTFPSAVLRVVTDDEGVLETRLLPLVIDRYRPTPLTGESARTVVKTIAARSALAASSERLGDQIVLTLDDATDEPEPVDIRFERNSGVLERAEPDVRDVSMPFDDDASAALPACTLVRTDLLADGVETADDLFGWGAFDRETTDGRRTFPVGWLVPKEHERWDVVAGTTDDPSDLAIELTSLPDTATTIRIAALIDIPAHRLYDDAARPVDDAAAYEIRLRVRRQRGETPFIRLATYARLDTDPTVAPETAHISQVELPIDVPDDDRWHAVTIPVPDALLQNERGGSTALNLIVAMPPAHLGTVTIDDVEVLEWRGRARTDQAVWAPATWVRSADGEPVELLVRTC